MQQLVGATSAERDATAVTLGLAGGGLLANLSQTFRLPPPSTSLLGPGTLSNSWAATDAALAAVQDPGSAVMTTITGLSVCGYAQTNGGAGENRVVSASEGLLALQSSLQISR